MARLEAAVTICESENKEVYRLRSFTRSRVRARVRAKVRVKLLE